MHILFYFDAKGEHHIAEQTSQNKDGTIALMYKHKGKRHVRTSVPTKNKATMIKSNPKDKNRTLASKFYKIVERSDK